MKKKPSASRALLTKIQRDLSKGARVFNYQPSHVELPRSPMVYTLNFLFEREEQAAHRAAEALIMKAKAC